MKTFEVTRGPEGRIFSGIIDGGRARGKINVITGPTLSSHFHI